MKWLAAVLLAAVFLLIILQGIARLRGRRTVGTIPAGIPGPLGEAIGRREDLVLVFTRSGCAACAAQEPAIDALRRDFPFVRTIDTAVEPETARRFRITATPTTVILRRGRVRAFLVGAQSEERLRTELRDDAPPIR